MNLYAYQTTNHCNRHLSQLNADNLNNEYMRHTKYLCEKEGSEYFHQKILNQIPKIRNVAKLGDISLYATYLNSTIFELNSNLTRLYSLFYDSEKFEVAKELRHLEGLKHLSCGQNYSHCNMTQFYYDHFTIAKNRIIYAIEVNDSQSFGLFLTKLEVAHIDLNNYLSLAYYYESFDIVLQLLSQGALFNMKDIIRVSSDLNYHDYECHVSKLKSLELLSNKQIDEVKSLISAMFSTNRCTCNYSIAKIGNVVHSTEILALQKITIDIPYNEIVKYIFGVMLAVNFPHALVPAKGSTPSFFSLSNGYYKLYLSTPSNEYFSRQYIHELTHAFLYVVFQNANAYSNRYSHSSESYNAYQAARENFLTGVLEELGEVRINEAPLELILANSPFLHINEYCHNSKSSSNLLLIMLKKYVGNEWNVELLFGQSKVKTFNQLLEDIIEEQDLIEFIEADIYFRKEKNLKKTKEEVLLKEMIQYISIKLDISTEKSASKLKEYKETKKKVGEFFSEYCFEKNLTKQYSFFLSRAFDYSNRDEKEWDSELLPRFVETYVHTIPDTKVVLLYKPIMQYWQSYVISKAKTIIENNPTDFTNVFTQEHAGNIWSRLYSFWQKEEEMSDGILMQELKFSGSIAQDDQVDVLSYFHKCCPEILIGANNDEAEKINMEHNEL